MQHTKGLLSWNATLYNALVSKMRPRGLQWGNNWYIGHVIRHYGSLDLGVSSYAWYHYTHPKTVWRLVRYNINHNLDWVKAAVNRASAPTRCF